MSESMLCDDHVIQTTPIEFDDAPGISGLKIWEEIKVTDLVSGREMPSAGQVVFQRVSGVSDLAKRIADASVIASAIVISQANLFGGAFVPMMGDLCVDRSKDRIPDIGQKNKWSDFRRQIASFAILTEGWNGYSAPAPAETAISNASDFLDALEYSGVLPTRIAPSAVGGVAITRRVNSKKVCIEFFNNGLISGLFADDVTEKMHTSQFESNLSSYGNAISEIEEYLNG